MYIFVRVSNNCKIKLHFIFRGKYVYDFLIEILSLKRKSIFFEVRLNFWSFLNIEDNSCKNDWFIHGLKLYNNYYVTYSSCTFYYNYHKYYDYFYLRLYTSS